MEDFMEIWEILGLEPTEDISAIKLACAENENLPPGGKSRGLFEAAQGVSGGGKLCRAGKCAFDLGTGQN